MQKHTLGMVQGTICMIEHEQGDWVKANEVEDSINLAAKAAAGVLLDPILRLLEADPHQFSERPCPTCRTISALAGKAFGCSQMALVGAAEFRKRSRS